MTAPVAERLVLVGDLHLGGGPQGAAVGPGFRDPFDQDEAFAELLDHLRRRPAGRPYRLVLLGDTFDFLRVPVTGDRTGLYARDDAEAVGQLDRIHAAHRTVFAGLARSLAAGAGVDVVAGNHDVELARPAVRARVRALLRDQHGCPPDALASMRFHPWGYHVPGLLYAEHGNHYHDINTFRRPLHPFRREGLLERPPAARLGGVRRLASGRPAAGGARDALADLLPRRPLGAVARSAYGSVLRGYADELGLAADVVARLHEMGGTSVPRIARRLLRSRLAGGPSYPDQLPRVAAAVHGVLSSRGQAASFYVFGHVHVARHLRLPGTSACYLNTGTWSAEGAAPAQCTWVEVSRAEGGLPRATLSRWAGGPVALPGPDDGTAGQLEEMDRDTTASSEAHG